ncbi:hypothetical protein IW140_002034 [Coemansia sp. RSA 1813]|nr:hypothetical protein IW140_002034 [Coemansia sp. RSA 1813]
MSIVRRLGHTKTLRQVAEFLDHMEFWAAALDTPKTRHKRLKLADRDVIEADELAIAKEEPLSETVIRKKEILLERQGPEQQEPDGQLEHGKQEEQMKGIVLPRVSRGMMLNRRFARLLASITVGADHATIGIDVIGELYAYLIEFVQNVVGDIIVRTKVASTPTNRYTSKNLKVGEAITREALAACGCRTDKSTMQTFSNLLDKYVDLSEETQTSVDESGSSDIQEEEEEEEEDPDTDADDASKPSQSPNLLGFVVYDDPAYCCDSPSSSDGLFSDDECSDGAV